ncbi:MAG TPA: restriction endonuclease subunit S [Acidobacteriota bacterium]|nr:restriction endonuclease subunit S [Acidobacteriota bacterium]
MATNWPRMTIAECAAPEPYSTQIGPFGQALMADEYVDSGIPVLRGVNVNRGRFHDDDFVFIDNETANRLAKFESFPGDVLLVHKGTLGKIGLMPTKRRYQRYIMGNSMMRVRCDPNKLLPEFLYYWLTSTDGQYYLFSRVSQVGVPQIQTPLTTLRQAELPVPPLPEQRAIASILGSLDDKIELNRKTCETLEEMARAIFKSWFVDFDPVRAKMSGEKSEAICARLGLTREMLELFPDRLVDSELGEIPEGWKVETIESIATAVGGSTPSTKESSYWDDGIYFWATPKDLSGLHTTVLFGTERRITEEGLSQISSGLLPVGTVLLSSRAPIGYRAITEVPVAINQGFIAISPNPGISNLFILNWLESAHETIVSKANGSTFLEINKANFRVIELVVPNGAIMKAFDQLARSLYQELVHMGNEIGTLVSHRDSLLPKLISGEIEVKGA